MTSSLWLLVLLATASCYSAGGGDDGGSEMGGSSAGGRTSGGSTSIAGSSSNGGIFGGGSSSGGSSAAGGSGGDQCGPCPGAACQQGVVLTITADPMVAPADLSELEVTADGLTLQCASSGDCTMYCSSNEYQLPDGHYTITITAPGFETATVEFDAVSPTNCGCCGCCPFSHYEEVTLVSDGSAVLACPTG